MKGRIDNPPKLNQRWKKTQTQRSNRIMKNLMLTDWKTLGRYQFLDIYVLAKYQNLRAFKTTEWTNSQ